MATYVAGDVWDLTATAPGAPDLSGFTVNWKLLDSEGDTVESDSASGDDQGVMTYTFNSSGYVSTGSYTSVFTADDGGGTVYTCSVDITSTANSTIGDLITLGEVIPSILTFINNPNRTTEVKAWIKEVCRDIGSHVRWNYLMKSKIHAISGQRVNLPDDWLETIDPLYIDTGYDTSLMSGGWEDIYTPWTFENLQTLRLQNLDYRIISGMGLYLNSRWTTGAIWMDYYRKAEIITYESSGGGEEEDEEGVEYVSDQYVPDIPRMFAYRLLVFGAARYGLLSEDDYDRLRYAETQYEKALADMKAWDARRGVANMRTRLSAVSGQQNVNGLLLPGNYSI